MARDRNIKLFEHLIYMVLWILVFLFPLVISLSGNNKDFVRFFHDSTRVLPYFILFLIHNAFVFKLFVKKKYWEYFFLTLILIVLFALFSMLIGKYMNELFRLSPKPPPRPGHIPFNQNIQYISRLASNALFGLLVVGLNNAIKIFIQWIKREREYEKMQIENAESKLSMLRQQISPHFFMNTLNNIHALIDYDKDQAKDSVVKLSKLMRILLYESETRHYTLEKEISFLHDYIEIMKIRIHDKVEVIYKYPDEIPRLEISPLLFINFVENAFKYGVIPGKQSKIFIEFSLENNYLVFVSENTFEKVQRESMSGTKMGMANALKRLDLIYRNTYKINQDSTDNIYKLKLKIPIE
ncbi:MAG: histidine kinase [Bacteroidales bacterium]|jgi:sensor histidine kinase YesM|nr:histidine kinase [Bacteroidales bacterium]